VINFPPPLADEIGTFITKGTNLQLPDSGFTDVEVAGTSPVPIVTGVGENLKYVKGETKLVEG
jgi:hypothetical protein